MSPYPRLKIEDFSADRRLRLQSSPYGRETASVGHTSTRSYVSSHLPEGTVTWPPRGPGGVPPQDPDPEGLGLGGYPPRTRTRRGWAWGGRPPRGPTPLFFPVVAKAWGPPPGDPVPKMLRVR